MRNPTQPKLDTDPVERTNEQDEPIKYFLVIAPYDEYFLATTKQISLVYEEENLKKIPYSDYIILKKYIPELK